MLNMKRNQVIITALVVMIAVAGYLNYVDVKRETEITSLLLTEDQDLTPLIIDDLGNVEGTLTNTNVVDDIKITQSTEEEIEEVTEETIDDAGSAIFVYSNTDDFFLQAKLVREQDRSKQREILTEMINNENLTSEQKSSYADEMLNIQKRIEKESSAEAMIEAKGFKEVYVRIDDETVDVVVGKESLTDAEIAQIEDIVKRKTGMDATQIRISPMQQ